MPNAPRRDRDRLAVTILTGFLGAGKTTLLNRLLRSPGLSRTLVIVNEFGEVGLDHLLVETPADDTILLANGCLCCSVLGDLVMTLSRALARRDAGELTPFDRVMIETTGLANPAPILRTLLSDAEISARLRLEGVIAVADGVNGLAQLDSHLEAVKQVAAADRIIISKADLASDERIATLLHRLRRMVPGAQFHIGTNAEPDIAALVQESGGDRDWQAWIGSPAVAHDGHGHDHHSDNAVRTFTVRRERPVSEEGLRLWLNALSRFTGPNLLRMKGLMNVEGRPLIVQAVQHIVHEPQALETWPSAERQTRVVFITHGLEREAFGPTMDALDYCKPTGRTGGLGFDLADYGRFVAAVRKLAPMERM